MASTSSAKKVARVAARSGGATSKKQSNWLFPVAIIAIVVLGVGIVALARNKNAGSGDNTTHPIAQLTQGQAADHWHNAFAIYTCGKELPALSDAFSDELGIHSHADGLIHIHPFSIRSAGDNATLGRFFDQVGVQVTDDGFKLPDGSVYEEGKTTCGGQEGELVLAYWKDGLQSRGQAPDKIIRSGFSSVRMTEDEAAWTLAFVPKGTENIPPPSSVATLPNPSDVSGGDGSNPITVPSEPATATTAAPATTAAGGAGG